MGMLGWSINLFRIRGIQLSLHFSFLLLLAYAGYEGWQDAGSAGVFWGIATLLAFFTCVVLHELGHSLTARRYGVHVRRILLMPIGGMAEFDSIPRQPSQELVITIAGPAVNFLIAAILWCVFGFPDERSLTLLPSSITELGQLLLIANFGMGIFNLIPVFPMDGGRILRALLATRLSYVRATFWASAVGKVLAGVCILFFLFLAVRADDSTDRFPYYLRASLFVFIFGAGEAEYRAVRRREFEEARWREAISSLYGPQDTEEPPVLTGDSTP